VVENSAYNGEVFICISGCLSTPIWSIVWYCKLLEDQKYVKIIPWEVNLKLN
jgi:hypothetical protein